MKQIFLDYASATPVSSAVRTAMEPYFSSVFYNPSALYLAAKLAKSKLELARTTVAGLLAVHASEVIFTAGSTEANNLAVRGIMKNFSNAHCIVSAIEHESVLHTAHLYDVSHLPVLPNGIIDLSAFMALVKDTTVLVSCMLANNEIGSVQPIAELAKLVAAVRLERRTQGNTRPIYLHTDASQAYNYMQVLPHTLGADMVVIGGSKIYGPKQTAVLFLKTGIKLQSQITGGGQEWGLRSGTENLAGCVGLAAALYETATLRKAETKRLMLLRSHFIAELCNRFETVLINGTQKYRLPNNVHITLPGTDNETLIMQLDEAGIMAAAGSACSASSDEPSHVLKAIGLSTTDAQSSLRFTMGRATTQADIDYTVATLGSLLHR